MTYPRLTTASLAVDQRAARPALSTVTQDRQPQRATPLTRRYEVAGLSPDGDITELNITAPATPDFESACGAFARGTLIATPYGAVAVEDLEPGMALETAEDGAQTLLWIGSMMVFPEMPGLAAADTSLIRIAPDTFGMGRPMPDLLLGSRARMLFRHQGCATMFGTQSAFAPARAFADGCNTMEIRPVAPVRVYHLGLHGQFTLRANGVEVESFHPGDNADQIMDPQSWSLFLSMFPHVTRPADFGPLRLPRLTAFEFEGLRAA